MKNKAYAKYRRKVFSVLFLVGVCICLIVLAAVLFNKRETVALQFEQNTSKELTTLRVGEKVKLEDIDEKFAKLLQSDRKNFQTHEYSVLDLSSGRAAASALYLDGDGYIRAEKSGVYQLKFAVNYAAYGYRGKTEVAPNIFNNTIAVLESEDKYESFPEDGNYIQDGHYILDRDVTVKVNRWIGYWGIKNFSGSIVNPDKHTLTIKATSPGAVGFCYNNSGIIDGLKIHFETDDKNYCRKDFYGIAQNNFGVIKNCELTGEVHVYADPYLPYAEVNHSYNATIFSKDGIFIDNTANLSVYCDGDIMPYGHGEECQNEKQVVRDAWFQRNNSVVLDANYYNNVMLNRARNIPYSLSGENTSCPATGETGEQAYTVTYKFPYSNGYTECTQIFSRNSRLEIPSDFWNAALGFSSNTQVLYWLVNGERADSLDSIRVSESLMVEPCTKYTVSEPFFDSNNSDRLLSFHNANAEVLKIGDTEENVFLPERFFEDFFNDPLNVLPEKIVLGKGVYSNPLFNEESFHALQGYLKNGGKIEVESGNKDFLLLNEKMLCSADGRTLLYYFTDEEQTEIILPSRIRKLTKGAFWGGEQILSLDMRSVNEFGSNALQGLSNLQTVKFGSNFNRAGSEFSYLMQPCRKLKSIFIDASNPNYRVQDGLVLSENAVVYALPTLTGRVEIPSGVMKIFSLAGSDIDELVVLPDTVKVFYESAVDGMKNLSKIIFGTSRELQFLTSGTDVNVPNLQEIVFSEGIQYIFANNVLFEGAALGEIVLPKSLMSCDLGGMHCTGFSVSAENERYKTVDGVLYQKPFAHGMTLAAYPGRKTADTYYVGSDTSHIASNAFAKNSYLKEVVFPESLTTVSYSAFSRCGALEKVVFKTGENIYLNAACFQYCSNLKEIVFEQKTATCRVENSAFSGTENLISFPTERITKLGEYAFSGSGLTEFIAHEELTVIGDSAFRESNLQSADLKNVILLSSDVFYGCKDLKSVTGANVTSIGAGCFMLSGIETVDFPKAASVGERAFMNCEQLKTAALGEEAAVGASAFGGCSRLESIEGRIFIQGDQVFVGAESLQKLDLICEDIWLSQQDFSDCLSLKELKLQCESGTLDVLSFAAKELTIRLDVGEKFEIEGKIPKTWKIYVSKDLFTKFRAEWLYETEESILPY